MARYPTLVRALLLLDGHHLPIKRIETIQEEVDYTAIYSPSAHKFITNEYLEIELDLISIPQEVLARLVNLEYSQVELLITETDSSAVACLGKVLDIRRPSLDLGVMNTIILEIGSLEPIDKDEPPEFKINLDVELNQ